jgi:hypothetical protein
MLARLTRPVNSWRSSRVDTPLSEPTSSDSATFGRVARQQVHLVGFAVELLQLRTESVHTPAHDHLAAGEHGVVEHAAPVLECEDQMRVQGVDDAAAPADIGVGSHPGDIDQPENTR